MNKIPSLLLLLVLMCSCTEKVDLDPRDHAVVVKAILEDTIVQDVQLFYTSYISEDYCPPVEDAEVYIERMKDTLVIERHDFYKVKNGLWQSDFKPRQLGIYKLTVNIPGHDTITATTQFPIRTKFIRASTNPGYGPSSPSLLSSDKKKSTFVSLYSFMDYIPEIESYSMVDLHHVYLGTSDHNDVAWQSHMFSTWMFEDYYYEGKYAISRYSYYMSPVDSLSHVDSDLPFTTTAIFCALSDYITLGGDELLTNGREYYVSDTNDSHTLHPLSYLVVQNISRDYEMYIKDVLAKSIGLNRKNESDLTHLWEKDEIYSNVKNALGLFAAECRYELKVKDWQYLDWPPLWERYDIKIPGWND